MGYSAKVVLRRPAWKDDTYQVRLIVMLDARAAQAPGRGFGRVLR